MSAFKTVTLEMARNPSHPEGSSEYGYEFVAPLKADGHIDATAFAKDKARCKVRRFWKGEGDRSGELVHTKEKTWAFSYEPGEDDDETFFRLDRHVFKPGEYVTIKEPDGSAPTFKVVSVR
jgi:hypothetical protein